MNLVDAKHNLNTRYQGRNESHADFYSKFKNRVEVIERQGGSVGVDKGLVCCRRCPAKYTPYEPGGFPPNIHLKHDFGNLVETSSKSLIAGLYWSTWIPIRGVQ